MSTSWSRRWRGARRCASGRARYVRLVLDRHDNNRRRAATALGISFHTLRTYMREMREVAASYRESQSDGGGGRMAALTRRRDIAGEPDGRGVAAQEEP